ncbi:hypothetical protein NESM_000091700 [Novymonas esmeraldas]|uniref:Uncharacterized protein n=1 Tax=Novymonas esmeraldas TaxID=1808958 RepID=A0AAW0F400_9TRYP
MERNVEPSFVLRHIHRCNSDERQRRGTSAEQSVPSATAYTTEVLLQVGTSSSVARGAPASPSSPAPSPVCYTCPAYMLEAGCPALREPLADAFDDATRAVARGAGDGAVPASAVSGSGAGGATAAGAPTSAVVLPLPYMDGDVFEVVAAYLEHFHAVDHTAAISSAATAAATAAAEAGSSRHHAVLVPTPLRRPLAFDGLYTLTAWEHAYVLCQLLGLPPSLVTSLRLTEDGAWVDLLGGAAAKAHTSPPRAEDEAAATLLQQQRAECFSFVSRRRMWTRVCRVLEAATRLGMPSLRLLCSTVAANMLVDLDAPALSRLMRPSSQVGADDEDGISSSSSSSAIPPFTPEARAQLLTRFAWLARS